VAAVAVGEHRGDGAAGDVEEAAQVHPGHHLVVLVGVVGERLGDEHSGVVDQGVDPAEPVQGLFDDVRAGARPGQVPLHREHFGVGAVDGAGGRDHGVAELAVGDNQARADAAGRAGDDGDFLREIHDRDLLSCRVSRSGSVIAIGYPVGYQRLDHASIVGRRAPPRHDR
jgi:hypothetical protein